MKHSIGRIFYLPLSATSLSVFRVSLGGLFLVDLFQRWMDLEPHYAPSGMLPTHLWWEQFWYEGLFSFHSLVSSSSGLHFVFAAHLVVILAFVAGYLTRWAALLLWVFVVSLQNRNPTILYAGDAVLRMMLLFMFLLPSGASSGEVQEESEINGFPMAVFLIGIYFFSSTEKLMADGWIQGTAMFDALGIRHLVTPWGQSLRDHPLLTIPMSWMSLVFELLAPFALFATIKRFKARLLVVGSFMAFHLITGMFFHVGLFPLIMLVYWTAFLPGDLWRRWEAAGQEPATPIVPKAFNGMQLAGLALAVYLGFISMANPYLHRESIASIYWNPVTNLLRLDHHWNMFKEPFVQLDGDLRVVSEKPMDFDFFKNHRWVKASMIIARGNSDVGSALLVWICREKNLSPGQEVRLEFSEIKRNKYPVRELEKMPYRVIARAVCG